MKRAERAFREIVLGEQDRAHSLPKPAVRYTKLIWPAQSGPASGSSAPDKQAYQNAGAESRSEVLPSDRAARRQSSRGHENHMIRAFDRQTERSHVLERLTKEPVKLFIACLDLHYGL